MSRGSKLDRHSKIKLISKSGRSFWPWSANVDEQSQTFRKESFLFHSSILNDQCGSLALILFGTFSRPAKVAWDGPAPWSAAMLNPEEETCSVLVYSLNQSEYKDVIL